MRRLIIKTKFPLREVLRLGAFNSCMFIGFLVLYFGWYLYFAQEQLDSCRCPPLSSTLFLADVFPEEMPRTYLMAWLKVFLSAVVTEVFVLGWFYRKKPFFIPLLPLFSFLRNLPGLLVVFTLMAQQSYLSVYARALIISTPLLFIYTLLHKIEGPVIRNKKEWVHMLIKRASEWGAIYVILLTFLVKGGFPLVPFAVIADYRFLFSPIYIVALLWLYRWFIIRKEKDFVGIDR